MAENMEQVKEDMGTESVMEPWEQHSGVISIPRFDYKAPTSLLHHSYSGFLVTCPIKREKSATKEAMSILEKYIGSYSNDSECLEGSDANVALKKRKITAGEMDGKFIKIMENKSEKFICRDTGTVSEDSCLPTLKSDANAERPDALSLVKLTRSGLVLFIFPKDGSRNVMDAVSNIMKSLKSGSIKSPLWCHRIFPIQATCTLKRIELCTLVSKLVKQFVDDKGMELSRPIKFAVGYNRRGVEETEMKGAKVTSGDVNAAALLDRKKCLEVVAAAVKDVVSDSVVDLKCPQLAVLVELLPISGVPTGSAVVAVSLLSQDLVSTKPRLCIKALGCDPNSQKGRKSQ